MNHPFYSQPEVLAPAGSHATLAAALRAGADAVYFGVGKLNMRARATANFSIEDIPAVVRKCRRMNVRAYLVLNTLIYDHELDQVRQICEAASDGGVDAVIASDIAAIRYARTLNLPVHLSVQANISNMEAVRFYAEFADVMILARELSLPAIAAIIRTIKEEKICGPSGQPVRIELFAHGALCVAVSGFCNMSLAVYDSSANRGACYQTCRRAYRVSDEETGEELVIDNKFVMSPRDICTISILDQILDAGVDILKLEGRGRSADYVDVVTRVYREGVDSWRDQTFSAARSQEWITRLQTVFNRGFWHGGHYLGEKAAAWCGISGNAATRHKIHVGKVSNYFQKCGVAELTLTAGGLSKGHEILVTGATTGAVTCTLQELRIDGKIAESAKKGDVVTLPVAVKLRRNDQVFRIVPGSAEKIKSRPFSPPPPTDSAGRA